MRFNLPAHAANENGDAQTAVRHPPISPFSAVLLAGGRSRRMGRDKAGILWRGEPLWQRQLTTLRASGADEVFISGRADGPYAEAGVTIVPDRQPGRGPLGGIAAALHHARHERLLVLAVDLPEMTPSFLRAMLHESESSFSAVVPRRSDIDRFEPLAAVYTRACLSLADACLRNAQLSLHHFARNGVASGWVRSHPVTSPDVQLFRNVNTPADL